MRAAIYVRQSLDLDHGIERQLELCAKLVAARGWDLFGEYRDNDVSATKPRGPKTAWHSMVADGRAGTIDAVIAVDLDRLVRTQRDLIVLIDLGLKVVTVDGEVDLSTADGTFRATMMTALARFEIQRKSERQLRANADHRAKGRPPHGKRAFGYTSPSSGHTPFEPEAGAVRWAFDLALATSLVDIARLMNGAGFIATRGGTWTPQTIRSLLTNPRYAALVANPAMQGSDPYRRRYDPTALSPGAWEPLVGMEQWEAVQRWLNDPGRIVRKSREVTPLLSGIATCARCGGPMKSGYSSKRVRKYVCRDNLHVARNAESIDLFIEELILSRLSQADATNARIRVSRTDSRELLVLQIGRKNLLSLVARGHATTAEAEELLAVYAAKAERLETRLQKQLAVTLTRPSSSVTIRRIWNGLDIGARREVVALLLHVQVMPAFAPWSRDISDWVSFQWRVS